MTDVTLEKETFFEEVLRSTVVAVRCNNCGSDQVMNTAYVKHVTNGLLTCSNCRNNNK